MDGCSNYNNLQVRKNCRTKEQARDKFLKFNVPHAKGLIFFNPLKAIEFAKEMGFPLVIKPNVSGFSRGSYFPITNYKALYKAILLAKLWWPYTVVEQYLEGKNYRIVVVNRKIMSVLQRYAPFVIGDGISTIEMLIDIENETRQKMNLFPCMSPLSKGRQSRSYLAKKGYHLKSIPMKSERVMLYYRISLAPGGSVEIIDKAHVSKKNATLFKEILTHFDANILGIDVIMEKGIDTDFNKQKCIFLEVNSRPYLKMHAYPRYGKAEDLSAYFNELDKLNITQSDIF